MQRFRSSPCLIQFTSGLEANLYSDPESDNQPEQQLNSSSEVIRVANLLDQVILLVTNAKPIQYLHASLGTDHCHRSNSHGNSH